MKNHNGEPSLDAERIEQRIEQQIEQQTPDPDVVEQLAGQYQRPFMYPKQEAAIFCKERIAAIEASTKSGKTVGCLAWLVEMAIKQGGDNRNFWWIAPSRAQALDVFDRLKTGLPRHLYEANITQRVVTLVNGSRVWFKTGEEPDLLYGSDVWAAVIDEASRMREDSWIAMQSTMTYTKGPVRIIGNVKGKKNWFWRLARRAEEGEPGLHYARITAADAIQAGVLDPQIVRDAAKFMPEQVYRELYWAEAAEDEGNPFGFDNIRACIAPMSSDAPVVWGWDLARTQDWTVGIGLDRDGQVSGFWRWRGLPWRAQVKRMKVISGSAPTLVDSTGVGDAVIEMLWSEKSGTMVRNNFEGYKMTPIDKAKLIEGLIGAVQGHEIRFPKGPISIELETFEYEYTRSAILYSAPEGMHDDCVIALALAVRKWRDVVVHGGSAMVFTARSLGLLNDEKD